eukprot:scaffold268395_cov42-Prasinocladus_malaysianus.AAC.1
MPAAVRRRQLWRQLQQPRMHGKDVDTALSCPKVVTLLNTMVTIAAILKIATDVKQHKKLPTRSQLCKA